MSYETKDQLSQLLLILNERLNIRDSQFYTEQRKLFSPSSEFSILFIIKYISCYTSFISYVLSEKDLWDFISYIIFVSKQLYYNIWYAEETLNYSWQAIYNFTHVICFCSR